MNTSYDAVVESNEFLQQDFHVEVTLVKKLTPAGLSLRDQLENTIFPLQFNCEARMARQLLQTNIGFVMMFSLVFSLFLNVWWESYVAYSPSPTFPRIYNGGFSLENVAIDMALGFLYYQFADWTRSFCLFWIDRNEKSKRERLIPKLRDIVLANPNLIPALGHTGDSGLASAALEELERGV